MNEESRAMKRLWKELDLIPVDSDERTPILKQLETISNMRKSAFSLNNPAVLSMIANVAGIGIIIFHERGAIITTKALNLLTKLKI